MKIHECASLKLIEDLLKNPDIPEQLKKQATAVQELILDHHTERTQLEVSIMDAAAWYGDTCCDPELFSDEDRARAMYYLRTLAVQQKKRKLGK